MPPLVALAAPPLGTLLLLLLGRRSSTSPGGQPGPVVEPPDVAPTPTRPGGTTAPTGDLALPLVPLEGQLPVERLGTAQVIAPETGAAFLRSAAGRKIARVPDRAFVAIMEIGPPLPRLPAPAPAVALGWQKVRTSDGREGFVSRELLQILTEGPNALPGPGVAGLGGWPFTTGLPPRATRRSGPLGPTAFAYGPSVVGRALGKQPPAYGPASTLNRRAALGTNVPSGYLYALLQRARASGASAAVVSALSARYSKALEAEGAAGGAVAAPRYPVRNFDAGHGVRFVDTPDCPRGYDVYEKRCV